MTLCYSYYKKRISIWGEFLPQLIFMISIFGYLVALIFIKWLFFDVWNMHKAPSLILTLINMGLMGAPDPEMFTGQVNNQTQFPNKTYYKTYYKQMFKG